MVLSCSADKITRYIVFPSDVLRELLARTPLQVPDLWRKAVLAHSLNNQIARRD